MPSNPKGSTIRKMATSTARNEFCRCALDSSDSSGSPPRKASASCPSTTNAIEPSTAPTPVPIPPMTMIAMYSIEMNRLTVASMVRNCASQANIAPATPARNEETPKATYLVRATSTPVTVAHRGHRPAGVGAAQVGREQHREHRQHQEDVVLQDR